MCTPQVQLWPQVSVHQSTWREAACDGQRRVKAASQAALMSVYVITVHHNTCLLLLKAWPAAWAQLDDSITTLNPAILGVFFPFM